MIRYKRDEKNMIVLTSSLKIAHLKSEPKLTEFNRKIHIQWALDQPLSPYVHLSLSLYSQNSFRLFR